MTGAAQYLLVIHMGELRDSAPVPPGDIASALDRSPAAVTEMLQRLETRGLVVHEPYEGATLTAEGHDRATDLYRTYRTLSQFFEEVLDLEHPEEEAFRIAGHVRPTVADRLSSLLHLESETGSVDDEPTPSFM